MQLIYGVPTRDEKALSTAIGVHSFFVKDYLQASQRYTHGQIEKLILLLHQYNLRSIGIGDGGTPDAQLLKEMVVKIMSD